MGSSSGGRSQRKYQSYEIHYVGEEFDTDPHTRTVNVSGDVQSFYTTLTGLEEHVVYDVKIRAYNHFGPSPYSSVQSVRTYAGL